MAQFNRVVNVIPLTRLGLGKSQIFTYLVPLAWHDKIRPGQLLKIPFQNREIFGVTSSMAMHRLAAETKGLKVLTGVLSAEPVLTEKNLILANWLSDYYICPLGLMVKAMLPKFVGKAKSPEPRSYERFNPDFVLNEAQHHAVSQISARLGQFATFLLHGVTGSGKTEVYMQVIDRLLQSHKQTIMMVPEISLTPQAVERLAKRFGLDKIALLHSRLKNSERQWMWEKIRSGEKLIIIGPRSAVFAPVQDLGMVIMDEEHDASFKQFDQNPKYHTRVVATKLCELWSCPLVLGDATPSVESYFSAISGRASLLTLPHRIKADVGMPRVKIVDMRQELASGNFSIFSESLKLGMLESLRSRQQIILFLNRRGSATFVMCRDCGHVTLCDSCEAPLVWHGGRGRLLCHHCGGSSGFPSSCPKCRGVRVKQFGIGTEGVETELRKFLHKEIGPTEMPKIGRFDLDTASAIGAGEKIYDDWTAGKIDILIGTQMVSKGWDVGRVGLVGILSGDSTLHLPDFRSNERTFQVLTQVAGRAGRGKETGTVILQTYHPENYAIVASKTHNFEAFFKAEIEERKKYSYPPFCRLVKLRVSDGSEDKARKLAEEVYEKLQEKKDLFLGVFGPAPAFITKLRGRYQFQIVIKISTDSANTLIDLFKGLPVGVDIDVDPESLL